MQVRELERAGLGAGITDPYTSAIEGIATALGQISGNVVPIAAAFGAKGAQQEIANQQAAQLATVTAQSSDVAQVSWSKVTVAAIAGGTILVAVIVLALVFRKKRGRP